jgi:hypothetical protein
MTLIKAKQIEGVLDTSSNQTVESTKRFTMPQLFVGGRLVMKNYQNYIYWCQTEGVLEEVGNSRLCMENGRLITQTYDGEAWINT